MSKYLDEMALQHQKETQDNSAQLSKSIRQGIQSGMTVPDVVDNLNLKENTQEPHKALASVALAEHYGITPEKAYGIYPNLKAGLWPNLSDEEIVAKMYQSSPDTLPETTVTEKTHAEKADEVLQEFPAYAKEREQAEEKGGPDPGGMEMLKSIFFPPDPSRKQAEVAAKERARRSLHDEWFGKGNVRDRAKERYYDSLFEADTDEERNAASQAYIDDLKTDHEQRLKDIERIEYQIEHNTEKEGFLERKVLAGKRAKHRGKSTLAKLGETIAKAADYIPQTKAGEKYNDSYIQRMSKQAKDSYAKSNAPELWRPELNWFDGATNAVIENAPTMGMAAGAGIIGGATAGPYGAKAGVFAVTYAAEANDIYQSALEAGFSPEEASRRANLGGAINGAIEAASGGVAKYTPSKKIAGKLLKAGGKLTRNTVKEVLVEEVPQETISAILSGNVPYNEDGTIDWDTATDQVMLVARDAAFMSIFYSSVQGTTSNLAAMRAKHKGGHDAQTFQNFEDNVNNIVEGDKATQASQAEGKYVGKYRLDAIVDYAVKNSIKIPSVDLKNQPYMLMKSSVPQEIAEGFNWHIKNFKDPANNMKFKTYEEALAKFQEIVPEKDWTQPIVDNMEIGSEPVEVEEAHHEVASPDYTEPLEHIDDATRFFLKDEGDGNYAVIDADTNTAKSTAQPLEQANKTKKMANLDTKTDDPLVNIRRFTKSREANGAHPNIYGPITNMLDPKMPHGRPQYAKEISNYVTELRNNLAKEYGKAFANEEIPSDLEQQVQSLPDDIGDLSGIDHNNTANTLRQVLRLGQLYGQGQEADQNRNWTRSYIKKVRKNKHSKPVLTEKDAQPNLWHKVWDPIGGVTKDDFITTLTKIFGTDAMSLTNKIISARTAATKMFVDMNAKIALVQADLQITQQDKALWSSVLGKKPEHHTIDINGEQRNLTMAQLMFLELANRDETASKIIEENGVAFPSMELGTISGPEWNAIHDIISQNQKASQFVDRIQDFYIDDRGKYVNEASLQLLGWKSITDVNFMPTNRQGPQGPLLIQDIFHQTSEDMRTAAHYAGIKPAMRQIRSLMSNKQFRRTVQNAGKGNQLKRFQQEMESMDKSRLRIESDLEKALSRLGANRARAILASGRIAMLQAGSYQLYQNETDTKYMRGGHAPKEVYAGWDMLRFREKGMGSVHSVVTKNTVRKAWNGRGSTLDAILWPMHKVDLMIVRQAATIAWHEMTDQTLTGKARRWWSGYGADPHTFKTLSPEFMEALYDRATYLAYSTQPMFFPESRNYYTQHDSVFLREMARFRSFTDQLNRNIARQYSLWQTGDISNREAMLNMGRNIMWATMWYNGLRFLWDQIFGDDDDDKNLLLETLTGPLSWIPFIGWPLKTGVTALFDESSGYGPANFSTITFDQINRTKDTAFTLAKAMKYSLNDERDAQGNWKSETHWKRGIRDAVRDTLIMFFGLPGDAIIKAVPEEDKGKKNEFAIR